MITLPPLPNVVSEIRPSHTGPGQSEVAGSSVCDNTSDNDATVRLDRNRIGLVIVAEEIRDDLAGVPESCVEAAVCV